MRRANRLAMLVTIGLLQTLTALPAGAAELKVLLPLGRVAYQTNEWIDVSVVRSSVDGLKEGTLALTLAGTDGSKLDFTFAVRPASGKTAVATEHLHLNGALLRPGKYRLDVAGDGTTATTQLEVYTHLRGSSFKTIDWASHASKHEQATLGEDSMGFNLMLYAYGGLDPDESIRGGLDYLRNCTLGGWHYMDLRRECDWSDPYVLGGGIARASKQAFEDRTRPNCLGVHLYDEPLLAEVKDPTDAEGKRLVRHGVPAQERSFRATFGTDPPRFQDMHFGRPEDARRWAEYNRWRLLLLEAAWKLSGHAVQSVEPDFVPISQTQWAWQAFDAGYYFNVNRPFPVVSRHALYDYKHGGDFSPSFAFEFGRIRDLKKPEWYLPMWGSSHTDLYRAEQYLSFMENLQGAAKPPDLHAHRPSRTPVAEGIVETNKVMLRLGTVFETLPVTRPETAVLYSMSHNLHERTHDSMDSYRGNRHVQHLLLLYIAGKQLHVPLFPVVEEDVLDGTLALHHKVVVLAGIDHLDPPVAAKLDAFRAGGGTVLLSDDSKVQLAGAVRFPFPPEGLHSIADMDRWAAEGEWGKWSEVVYTHRYFRAAEGVAAALRPRLEALGVRPVLDCDQSGVVASREALGDIEYLFTVNVSPDPDTFGWYFLRGTEATLRLPADGRVVYDALQGGSLAGEFRNENGRLAGTFRFGPGQMRAFARTARPIGGVQVLTPLLSRDYTEARQPSQVELTAILVDEQRQPLCGSAPLHVEVIDPLKTKRYDLYRATDRGILRLALPLAANDPGGEWQVVVHDLLGNTQGRAAFTYRPATQCAALAGATRRAVTFGRDRDNVFRFFRTHKDLTLAIGTSPFDASAAERLAQALEPWDIRCQTIKAAEVKRHVPTAAEKPTWVDAAGSFDLRGPVVLVGNPDDNALIRHLRDQKFLPHAPVKDQFPGHGRGLLAWQREGLAYFGHESLTLIAYDDAGMAEAVGTAYEIAAGMEPLTPLVLPDTATVTAATQAPGQVPAAVVAWQTRLPDRVAVMRALPGGVAVLSADGTLAVLRPDGSTAWRQSLVGGEAWALEATRDGRVLAVSSGHQLHLYDGSGKHLGEVAVRPPDAATRDEGIGVMRLAPDGAHVFLALGRYHLLKDARGKDAWTFGTTLCLCDLKGGKLWEVGGVDEKAAQLRLPERCRAAAFAPDGKKLVVLTEKRVGEKTEQKAQVIDAATGKLGSSIAGVTHILGEPIGANLLLGDGDSKLLLFAPAEEKVVGELDCAKAGPVACAAARAGIVVGTEADGGVRLVKGVTGKLAEQTRWQDRVETKIVKGVSASGSRVLVTYWGGTLRLFDDGGALRTEPVLPQDVTATAWAGGRVVAGLADGRVLALDVP
jgi:hypothetical protein